ncbi:Uncharacterised protein [Sphingobacterium mizutaii]|uniref:Uncharacterized protein n=1 Tax=Sphingobacterium mizutaii TaxID=1010 RepID=A0AAJ4XEL3_9SPHI|nr:hypothetical protein SAMN05192578_104236 [Sphingobacterium mizutaii]SNV62402.1 Uncharacterised protein [Sphingobacterium mizutaii]
MGFPRVGGQEQSGNVMAAYHPFRPAGLSGHIECSCRYNPSAGTACIVRHLAACRPRSGTDSGAEAEMDLRLFGKQYFLDCLGSPPSRIEQGQCKNNGCLLEIKGTRMVV